MNQQRHPSVGMYVKSEEEQMYRHKNIKIAAIMDEFTYKCYAPECELLQVTPDNFMEEIDNFEPQLLFIESAWRGKDNLWRGKLHDDISALSALSLYCRDKNIPIVFWSKEDPVHFGLFVGVAALADVVFTTDADCIELYKAHLGHERVYYLPFAAQPEIHNPIEEYDRKDKFCFAGSFYAKYKERSRVFLELAPLFQEYGLDIFDRNFKGEEAGKTCQMNSANSTGYSFPPELQKDIIGNLPYSDISRAYKGYKYGINLTSMVQSGYMFARRVFELLACNTVTVSNYSRGLSLLFGELLIHTNNKKHMEDCLKTFCGTEMDYRKFRLAGLRHVLLEHLYEDRLNRVVQKTLGYTITRPLPKILVVCLEDNAKVRRMFENQSYNNKFLLTADPEIRVGELSFDFITYFSAHDYYGKNYLMDLALATRFSDDSVIGKTAYYSRGKLLYPQKVYTHVYEPVALNHQMIAKSSLNQSMRVRELCAYCQEAAILSLDEFNYCENAAECKAADDLNIDTGIPLDKVYAYTDNIPPTVFRKSKKLSIEEVFEEIEITDSDFVKKSYSNGKLKLSRDVEDDSIVWLRTSRNYDITQFAEGNCVGFFTETEEKSGNVRCQIEYYDKDGMKIDYLNFTLDKFCLLWISARARTFKLIFRMRGKAFVTIKDIYASSPATSMAAAFPMKKSLMITERYPQYDSLGICPELHRIVKGQELEVLLVEDVPGYIPYSEYDGVQIISCQYNALGKYLTGKSYEKVYVYNLSEELCKEIAGYVGKTEVISL